MLGTLSTLDPLVLYPGNVLDFGEDAAYEAVQRTLDAHNVMVRDMLMGFVEVTEEPILGWGVGVDDTPLDELDEFGTPNAYKFTGGTNVGFPLRNYGATLQWTRKYFQNTKAADFAQQINNLLVKDTKTIQREYKRALFGATNYTFVDRLVSENRNLTISVKRLVNADSASIPNGPNAEVFDGASHTHYTGSSTLTNAALKTHLENVVEHYNEGEAMININRAQETTVRGLSDFVPYVDSRTIPSLSSTTGRAPLDTMRLYNRAIGVFNGAEVWVKPWMIASYVHAWMKGAPAPLKMRKRKGGTNQLTLVSEVDAHPLRAKMYEREFGMGVHERTNGAIMYVGGASYTAPTIS